MTFRPTYSFSVALGLALASPAILTAACGSSGDSDLGDDKSGVGQDDGGTAGSGSGSAGSGSGTAGSASGTAGAGSGTAGSGTAGGPAGGVLCGPKTCGAGEVCCNESCGICTPPGGACIEIACVDGGPPATDGAPPTAIQCGDKKCGPGLECCNESCGICTKPGEGCTKQICGALPDGGPPCGPNTCAAGEVCCNESCGICTPPGGACDTMFCGPVDAGCTKMGMCVVGFEWSMEKCDCVPVAGECKTEADCTLVDDYCGGCNCLALADPKDAPTCSDPVACFAEPCMTKKAACDSGKCVAVSK